MSPCRYEHSPRASALCSHGASSVETGPPCNLEHSGYWRQHRMCEVTVTRGPINVLKSGKQKDFTERFFSNIVFAIGWLTGCVVSVRSVHF